MEKSDFKKPFNKPVLEKIGKYNAQVVALASVFILVSLVGFGIGLIDPSLLYATIPLIVIPAFFSFQTSLSVLLAGKGISNRINYSSYMSYFIPPFKGSYRVIVSYFKSLLVFAFFSLITGSIYYGIASNASPSFVDAINKLFGTTKGIERIHIEDIIKLCNNNIGNKYLTPNKKTKIVIKNKKIYIEAIK